MNDGISDLAAKTRMPRSIVARAAFKRGKLEKSKRSLNRRNAWLSLRMEEVNQGM